MIKIQLIRTKENHAKTLAQIGQLMSVELRTREGDDLGIPAISVEAH